MKSREDLDLRYAQSLGRIAYEAYETRLKTASSINNTPVNNLKMLPGINKTPLYDSSLYAFLLITRKGLINPLNKPF